MNTRTIISALHPRRYRDSFTEIFMTVWFEEFDGPIEFCASPLDCERHGKELWIRAMGGEYGTVAVIDESSPLTIMENAARAKLLEASVVDSPMLLEYHGGGTT